LTSSTTSTTTTTTSTDISVWVREVANDQSVALNLTLSKLFDVLLSEVDGKESMTGSISRYLLALDSIVQLAVQIAHRGQHHTQESNASTGGQVANNLVKQVPIVSRAAAAVDRIGLHLAATEYGIYSELATQTLNNVGVSMMLDTSDPEVHDIISLESMQIIERSTR